MNRRTIVYTVALISFSLLGMIVTQLHWVEKTLFLQEKNFESRTEAAMRNTAEKLLSFNLDSTTKVEPVIQQPENFFACRVNTQIDTFLLRSVLSYELAYRDVTTDYFFGAYDCFADSITAISFFSGERNIAPDATIPVKKSVFTLESPGFWIYFVHKKTRILREVGWWLAGSVVLTLMMIFSFCYTIFALIRQKKIEEIKADFVNNMTHEFKTPISTIGLSAEVLLKPDIVEIPERLYRYAGIIRDENNRLKMQVEKVLQAALFEKGRLRLNKEEINIHELLKICIDKMSLVVEKQNGKLTANLLAKEPFIIADRTHIENVIDNLLDNAIKYSAVHPEVAVTAKNQGFGVLISVTDKGIGMQKKVQRHIFEKFYRIPAGDTHDVKGFGLGLYYVKTIVDAHRGRISVTSEKNKGSTFETYLPFRT